MELPRTYMQCDRAHEGISRLTPGRQNLCTRNATVEDRAAKNTSYSSCSEQLNQPNKVLYTGKPESATSWNQFSKINSPVVCHSEDKSSLPSGSHQMSSFERACYEDFQTYIPEITAETQFVFPGKLCEENPDYGRVSSAHPAVNQDRFLTHYPNSRDYKVLPSARHCYYSEGVEPFPFKGSKDKASRALGNCKYNEPTPSLCLENGLSCSSERYPDLRYSKSVYPLSLKDTPQAPPNKVVNHFGQQLCPTVSIRVDISCPLSPCSCNKISCCCRDAQSNPRMPHSYGNIPGNLAKRSNGLFQSNIHQSLPGTFNAKANSFTGKLCHASPYSSSCNADVAKCQFKSDCFSGTSVKPFPPSYETAVNNRNGYSAKQRERFNDHMCNLSVAAAQNGKCAGVDQRPYQIFGSDTTQHKKFAFPNARDETLNSSAVKCEDKMRWGRNITGNFSAHENPFMYPDAEKHNMKNGTFYWEGSQTNYTKDSYLPKTAPSSYQDIIELRPVDPGKIFGQYKFQTCAGNTRLDEKYTYAEPQSQTLQSPTLSHDTSPVQGENPANTRDGEGLNDQPLGLLMEPSSPIANLSNLVAKIHPDHENIMTGQKNVKVEGERLVII